MVGFPLLFPAIFLHYYTMILQRIGIIVGDAGFEPLARKSGALPMSHHISIMSHHIYITSHHISITSHHISIMSHHISINKLYSTILHIKTC